MALALKLDTIKDAEVQQSLRTQSRLVRTGFLSGITPALFTDKKTALIKAMETAPGIPLLADQLDATNYPQYRCVFRIARPIPSTGGQCAWVYLHYETPNTSGTPLERFAAEDVTTLVSEATNVFPGTAQQLLCSTDDTLPVYDAGGALFANERPITANYPRVMRALVLYGLFADRPNTSVRKAANKVNDAEWAGLPKGYWRCEGPRVRYSNRDGMYAVSVGFLAKGDEDDEGADWTTYEVPRGADGSLLKVDSDDLQDLYDGDYEYGVRSDTNGLWAGGLYKLWDFGAVFGDESDWPLGD